MNKLIQKAVSLILLLLITMLGLDYLKVIEFNSVLQEILSFITIVLMIFSSTIVICTSKSGLNKFINYLILISVVSGVALMIYQSKFNFLVYASLLFIMVYSLMDMLYKRPN